MIGIVLEILSVNLGGMFVAFRLWRKEHRKGHPRLRLEFLKLWNEPLIFEKTIYTNFSDYSTVKINVFIFSYIVFSTVLRCIFIFYNARIQYK